MTTLQFHKLHAAGNDFIVVVRPPSADRETIDATAAVALLDRHRGIGGDTLLVLTPGGDDGDCSMVQYERDGSMGEMTGNGIRCLAYVADRMGLGADDRIIVQTPVGQRRVELERDPATGEVGYAWVAMGDATFVPEQIPVEGDLVAGLSTDVEGTRYIGDAVGIGNPHLVNYVDDVDAVPVDVHGGTMEHDPRFPNRTNVHWVSVLAPDRIRMRTWERGVGPTLACGTGATATVAALHRRGRVGERVVVECPGGELQVIVGTPMRLGGPVTHVFDTELDVARLVRMSG